METITGFFTGVPIDWFVISGIIILVTLDTLRSGLGRANALVVAFVAATAFYLLVDTTVLIGSMEAFSSPISQASIFGALVSMLYAALRRMGLDYIDGGIGEPIQALIAGAAVAVVVAITWLQVPALDGLWQLGDQTKMVFSEGYRLFWLLGAFAGLAFARG